MSDEIDPNWPPPQPKVSGPIDPNWPPPPREPRDYGETQSRRLPPGGVPDYQRADSPPSPEQRPVGTGGRTGWLNRNSGWVAVVAGVVGVAVGALVVLGVVSRTHQSGQATSPPSGSPTATSAAAPAPGPAAMRPAHRVSE
jgi:hypothetical protein